MGLFGLEIGANFSAIGSGLLTFVKILLFLALPTIIGFFIYNLLQYKYVVDVVHLTGSKKVVVRDKAKKVKDKKKVTKLWLRKTKERIALPPDEICDTNQKGKVYFSVYRTQEGQYVWRNDTGLKKGIEYPEGKEADEFTPMTTMDRAFYASEWEEAEKYNRANVWEFLGKAAPMIGIIIILVLLLVYWQDVAQPVKDMAEEANKALEKIENIKQIEARIGALEKGTVIPEDEMLPEKDPGGNDE